MSLKRKAAASATDASKKPKQNGSITAFFSAPKPNPNAPAKQTIAAAKFDREAWVAKLTEEQKDLLQLELDTLHESWLPHLHDVLLTPQFLELKRFLKKELSSGPKPIYPPMKDVYSWYELHGSLLDIDQCD
jgi:uracil-DNA glycosylase